MTAVRYDTVLLDLDLTLFDFHASERLAFVDCLAALDAADRVDEIFPRYRVINGGLWARVERGELTPDEAGRRRFEVLCDEFDLHGAHPGELGEQFQHGLGAHGDLYPGATDVLDTLAEHVPLALVTNGLSTVQRAKIDRLGLEQWFGVIVISGEVGVAKPDPAMFDLVFERLGDPARPRSIMIGDSLSSDIAGAHAAGVASCWFNPHKAAAPHTATIDHQVHALDQIPAVVAPR